MMLLPAARPGAGRVSFDHLVQHNARRAPDAVALFDAPDRPLWTEGGPRRLTWAQVDAGTAAIAARFAGLGLGADAVVAIQGPNSADTLLAILGCQRANLIPALMPPGWRNAEAAVGIERAGARAIFAANRAGSHRPSEALREVAAQNFAIRFLCGFGAEVPDGVIPFEDCFAETAAAEVQRSPRLGNPAEHIAVITFDAGPGGPVPVARTHNEWLSAGLLVLSQLGLSRDSVLLATLSPTSFAGIATGLVPWLMAGSTLILHQAFDATVLGVQLQRHAVTHAVLPSVVLGAATREGLFDAHPVEAALGIVRRADLPPPPLPAIGGSELIVFGEIGATPALRGADGYRIPFGRIGAPPDVEGSPDCIETGLTQDGTLALRGAVVPRAPFPGTERAGRYALESDGWVSSGVPASLEEGRLAPTGPRRDIVSMGGQAVALAEAQRLLAEAAGTSEVEVEALSDPILGQRLAFSGHDGPGLRAELAAHLDRVGGSPLIAAQGVAAATVPDPIAIVA